MEARGEIEFMLSGEWIKLPVLVEFWPNETGEPIKLDCVSIELKNRYLDVTDKLDEEQLDEAAGIAVEAKRKRVEMDARNRDSQARHQAIAREEQERELREREAQRGVR